MASRLPSAVTNIPANREWVEDGKSGILVPCKSPQILAEAIVKLLEDEELRKSLGSKAYQTVMKKADWKKNSKLLDSLVSSMLKSR
jgi:glycosyltransferase involved in cell wall biosynthesis